MNPLIQLKTTPSLLITLALLCFGLLPKAEAVNPPPAGGLSQLHHCCGGQRPSGSHLWHCEHRQLVSFRCLASPLATTTPLLVLERLILTLQTTIRPLALQRFCLTPPAQKTRPVEQPRLNLTIPATSIRPTEHSPCLLTREADVNTAIGDSALLNNITGNGNIALGANAGSNLTIGNFNIDIGNSGVAGESNMIRIGEPAVHTGIFLAGITAMTPEAPNQAVLVDPTTGQLGSADLASFQGPPGPTAKRAQQAPSGQWV